MQPVAPWFNQLADGNWHRYTMMYKPNTAAGARDGIARMWIDGTKILDISASACGITPPGGEKPWCALEDVDLLFVNDGIREIKWGGTYTGNTISQWTYDFDDFIWWSD